jgi:SEC-C motif-containing protein
LLYQEGIAQTAEQLMRARFSAYVMGATDFLLRSWDPETRPQKHELTQGTQTTWNTLEIIRHQKGGPEDETGLVEFVAQGMGFGQPLSLHETSRFRRVDELWLYIDGVIHPAEEPPGQISRNAPCPCGSGKKFKRCCSA